MNRPTRERLLELFDYDPATGIIKRRISTCSMARAGAVAGCVKGGYRYIMVDCQRFHATTLIWMMMTGKWPDRFLDHKDTYGPKCDWGDRWENLRLASRYQNARNSRAPRNNTSGVTGIFLLRGKWRASICVANRSIWLGTFHSKEEATRARREAEAAHFGEFAPQGIAA